jgi:hypothetical protein
MKTRLRRSFALLSLGLAGCSGSDFTATQQGGDSSIPEDSSVVDLVTDSQVDSGAADSGAFDSAADTGSDSSADSSQDSSLSDSSEDSQDSSLDVAVDSSPIVDATSEKNCTTISLAPTDDTLIVANANLCDSPGTICYGTSKYVHVAEQTGASTYQGRGLIRFSLPSGLGKIQSAVLTVSVADQCDSVTTLAGSVMLNLLRTDWVEGTCVATKPVNGATWSVRMGTGTCWNGAGASTMGVNSDISTKTWTLNFGKDAQSLVYKFDLIDLAVFPNWISNNAIAFRLAAGSGSFCFKTKEQGQVGAAKLDIVTCPE